MATQLLWLLMWIALAVYASVFLLLALQQRSFLYHPTRGEESEFLERAVQQKVQPWRDAKGTLVGWKRERQGRAANRMLLLHSNGATL